MSTFGSLVAALFWLSVGWVIWREWRADAQVRADAASIREFDAAREALR